MHESPVTQANERSHIESLAESIKDILAKRHQDELEVLF
jgi:hypothetical protein